MVTRVEESQEKQEKTNIWTSLLKAAASRSDRSLPRRTLLVLGGSVSATQDFVDSLRQACRSGHARRSKKQAIPCRVSEIATYTYIDIEDTDMDESIGRLCLYLLPGKETGQLPALQDFIEASDLQEVILCVLLDWRSPWTWLKSLQYWLSSMAIIMQTLRASSKTKDEIIQTAIDALAIKIRTFSEGSTSESSIAILQDPSVAPKLSIGQFDRPLGIPLMCIAQNSDNCQFLEKEYGMKEEQFDFIQQVLRTILLRHGGSLFYTSLAYTHTMTLIRRHLLKELLEVRNLSKSDQKEDLASTVVRDQVYVPAGWDSWPKLSVLREGFDVEAISRLWTKELDNQAISADQSLVNLYEDVIKNPLDRSRPALSDYQDGLEIVPIDRLEILQQIEQRQWEVQDAVAETNAVQEHRSLPESLTAMTGARTTSSKAVIREANSAAGIASPGKNSADKDEYVQAFFQNLLSRRESDRAS